MVWREPTIHVNDCYFCMIRVAGVNSKTLGTVKYPNIPSVFGPISHSNELPVLIFKSFADLSNGASSESSTEQDNDECEKLRAEMFDGPQIRRLTNDKRFVLSMTAVEKNAWLFF